MLDLSGTEALHKAPAAPVLARFAKQVEQEVGVTVSIGLAANRLMAKIAAGRDKPRGFFVVGASEAASLLAPEPVRLLPHVPEVLAAFFWTVPALFSDVLAYFYVIFLAILLTDRAFRDDNRCAMKYGADWDEYKKRVPYKIIPGIV